MKDRIATYRFVHVDDDKVLAALAAVDQSALGAKANLGDLNAELAGLNARSKAAADAMDKVADQEKKTARESRDLDKTLSQVDKRLAAVAGSAKAMGSALGAAVLGLSASALLEMGEEGAGLQTISRRLEEAGVAAEFVADKITRLGGGSVASVEKLISRAKTAGVALEDMGAISDAALQISIDRGETSAAVFETLTAAIAKGEAAELARYGVVVDAKRAEEAYAASLGKSAAELTKHEKIAANSKDILAQINAEFSGEAPDKYASNISGVRDAFDDVNDSIKRLAGDALSDLGAVIGALRSGGEAGFASDPVETKLQFVQRGVADLERIEKRLLSAKADGVSKLAETVLELQDDLGAERFTELLGLQEEATRFTAGYIDALGRTRTALANVRKQEAAEAVAEAERQAQAEATAKAKAEARQRAIDEAREAQRRKDAAKRAAEAAAEQARAASRAWRQAQLDAESDLEAESLGVFAPPELTEADRAAMARALEERLKLAADMRAEIAKALEADDSAALADAGARANAGDFADRLAAIQEAADLRIEIARREADELARIAAEEGTVLTGAQEALQARITEINADSSRQRRDAWIAEAQAQAASFQALASSAETLAEAVGGSEAAIAAIKGGAMVALAAEETAKAIASGAAYDYIGAAQHSLAAAASVVAAVEHFKVAGGGGGAAKGKKTSGGGASRSPVDENRARDPRDTGPQQHFSTINLYAQVIGDPRETVNLIARAQADGASVPGIRRSDIDRVRR